MQDIIYSEENDLAVYGPATGADEEMLPVVDEHGVVLGQIPRSYAHSGAKPLHPVVHLHIIDRQGRVFLLKRSMSRSLWPGRWDTAVGGHVSFGERILEALCREASEELGLHDFNPSWIDTYVYESRTERELVFVFAIIGDYSLNPSNAEVTEGRYWTEDQILSPSCRSKITPNFLSEYKRLSKAMQALL